MFWLIFGIITLSVVSFVLGYVLCDYLISRNLSSDPSDDDFILDGITISDIKSANPYFRRTIYKE